MTFLIESELPLLSDFFGFLFTYFNNVCYTENCPILPIKHTLAISSNNNLILELLDLELYLTAFAFIPSPNS